MNDGIVGEVRCVVTSGSGWHSQQASDLLAVLGPAPVGMAANRIPALLTRLGDRRFCGWQAEIDAQRPARGRRPRRPV